MLNAKSLCVFSVTLLITVDTFAQNLSDTLITMRDAILLSEQRYPLLKAREYEANAATEDVNVAKYSRLPTIDATYQAGIATANNLTGLFNPNGILPITGPPSTSNN